MLYSIDDVRVLRDSGKALLIESSNLEEDIWIPQSQVHDDSEVWKENDEGTLVITDWFARKMGWK